MCRRSILQRERFSLCHFPSLLFQNLEPIFDQGTIFSSALCRVPYGSVGSTKQRDIFCDRRIMNSESFALRLYSCPSVKRFASRADREELEGELGE
jgi:hypothetical protein